MRFCAVLTVLSLASSCARPSAPAPASVPMQDYEPIAADRCSPALDGVFLSWEAARRGMVREHERETACKLALIDANEARDIEAVRRKAAEEREKHAGVLLPVAVGIGGTLVGFVAGLVVSWARGK